MSSAQVAPTEGDAAAASDEKEKSSQAATAAAAATGESTPNGGGDDNNAAVSPPSNGEMPSALVPPLQLVSTADPQPPPADGAAGSSETATTTAAAAANDAQPPASEATAPAPEAAPEAAPAPAPAPAPEPEPEPARAPAAAEEPPATATAPSDTTTTTTTTNDNNDNGDAGSVVTVQSMERSVASNDGSQATDGSDDPFTDNRVKIRRKPKKSASEECYLYAALCVHLLSCCTVCEELDEFQIAEQAAKQEKLRLKALEEAGEIDRFGCKRKKSKPRKKLTTKQKSLLKKAGVKLKDRDDEEKEEAAEAEDPELNEATPSGQRRALMLIRETTEKTGHKILNWSDDWDFVDWQGTTWTPYASQKQLSRALVVELDLCYQHVVVTIEEIRPLLGPQLEVLKIGWNQGLTGDIQCLRNCTELRHCNLHATGLVGNIEVFSENCPLLEVLGLSMCLVEGDMEVFTYMEALQEVYVDHTKIVGDPDAIHAARKRKKPFPIVPLQVHGYIHRWWEETDEDRRRRNVRTYRAGFDSNEDFFTAEAAGFPFRVGYDALRKAGFKTKAEYDAKCAEEGYTEKTAYDNHGVPIIMGLLEKAQREAEQKKREAAKRALMFEKSGAAESHTPREEMKMIDINAQFAL